MQKSRREFIVKSILLTGTAGINMSSDLSRKSLRTNNGNRLVLLGTQGGPLIRSYKQTPSASLIVYKDIPIVIDTGYGATFKLCEAGVNLSAIRYIFITHLHSDHYLDLGPLLYNAWITGLAEEIHIYAPAGIKKMLNDFWKSNKYDITTRIKDEGRPDIRKLAITHELREGMLIANPDFEISCLKNFHPPLEHSYAFKFKMGNKKIVFSGDTAYCPPLAGFATEADYLIHEVMYVPAVDNMAKRRPHATRLIESIKSHHTSAEEAGKIANAAGVRNLILNHFVPPDDKSLTEQMWIDAVRINFSGNILVGKDLAQFEI